MSTPCAACSICDLPGAVERVRAEVRARAARFGEQHMLTADARVLFARELDVIGDPASALEELDRAIAVHRALGVPARRTKPLHALKLDIAVRSGRHELVDEAALGSVRDGGAAPISIAEWLAVSQSALDRGELETARVAIGRVPRGDGPHLPARDELSAVIAAIDGDVEILERDAREPPAPLTDRSPQSELRISIWLRGLAEVARGKRAAAEARLAGLAPVRDRFLLGDGILQAGLANYRAAEDAFELARGRAPFPRGHAFAASNTWLGVTRVELGDARGAIAPLEEALDNLARCCGGRSWLLPSVELSLARALWQAGRDRPRARQLAESARDHLAKLRTRRVLVFPSITLDAAERWLAEHTAELAAQPVVVATGCPLPKDPKAPGKHKLYLAAEGISLTRSQVTDARKNATALLSIDSLRVPPFLDGLPGRAARIAAIAAIVQDTLAPYSIDVVLTRPTSGDYWMTVMGGTPGQFQLQSGIISLAPFDCSATPNTVDLVFDVGTQPSDVEYARSILSDFGAMQGLANVEEEGDCMCRSGRICEKRLERSCTFGAAGVLPVPGSPCGRTEQDESALLKAALGCR